MKWPKNLTFNKLYGYHENRVLKIVRVIVVCVKKLESNNTVCITTIAKVLSDLSVTS